MLNSFTQALLTETVKQSTYQNYESTIKTLIQATDTIQKLCFEPSSCLIKAT